MRRAATGLVGLLVLSGCASASPHADLRTDLARMVDAANSGNRVALVSAVGDFQIELDAELTDHRLTGAQHDALSRLATRIGNEASSLRSSASIPPTVTPATAAPPSAPAVSPTGDKKKKKSDGNGGGGGGEGDQGGSPSPAGDPGLVPSLIGGTSPSPSDSPSPSAPP